MAAISGATPAPRGIISSRNGERHTLRNNSIPLVISAQAIPPALIGKWPTPRKSESPRQSPTQDDSNCLSESGGLAGGLPIAFFPTAVRVPAGTQSRAWIAFRLTPFSR